MNDTFQFCQQKQLMYRHSELKSSSFITFSISSIHRDKNKQKVKEIINDGSTHLVVGPTTYFLCISF